MRAHTLDPNRYLYWSIVLAAAIFAILMVYPQLRALTLPPERPETGTPPQTEDRPSPPQSYTSLLTNARARLATLPAGTTERKDIADRLRADAIGIGFTSSPDLTRAAELQARSMAEFRFRSRVDQNGMDAAERLAMLDRVNLYSLVDEGFGTAPSSGTPDKIHMHIAAALDVNGAASIKSAAYNLFGVGCVEGGGEVICVRTVAKRGGKLDRPLPPAMPRGSAFDIQPTLENGATPTQLLLRDTVGVDRSPNPGTFSGQVRLPGGYAGLLRLRIVVRQGDQEFELRGPTVDAR